jgi:hypothetical protein
LLYFFAVPLSLKRKVFLALAVLVPSLLFSTTADASPVRKAHVRAHRVIARRVMTPTQAFARVAARHPEQQVHRHPRSWLQRGHHAAETPDHDAAIQNNVAPASTESSHEAPALRPIALLVPAQAQIQSHVGFAQSSPRAPPAFY